ncbi:hypothetical protein BT96DRAFT_1005328 [Gymnopus androsaceus JB14]|uniref:DUF4100 domain-containing protein n=1 Tax=Gymnopus androsaceus JB14 TaxID=1447944 RepID=A0A6A4GPQ4_9AGAR|nr:hypothetical protein BT96DRAFT_1005328 [Gymnopus androsaceus JB14]
MSIYPPANTPANTTNVYNLRVPMPIPRTQDAPHFNGQYIGDFLNCIIQRGAYAGITNADNLVNYIVEYSSDKVKDLILYMAEFDPDTLWYDDKPKEYTEEEMISFCRDQSAKSAFTKSAEIEAYYRAFIPIAASLKKQGIITDNQFNLYFVKGLPGSDEGLPRSRQVDKDSIIYEDWKHADEDKAKSEFDDIGNRVTVPTFQEDIVIEPATPGSSAVMPTQDNVQRKLTNMDEITRKLDALTLAVQNQRAPPRQNQGSDSIPARCFMCGQSGAHPLGIRFCPETNALISERLLTFNAQRNRYVLPDGQDLPRVPFGWNGGVSSYLRQNRTASMSTRDPPPHQPNTGVVGTVGLMYGDSEVLSGNAFALEALPFDEYSTNYYANPSLRSGKDTTNRFNPINRPEKAAERTPARPVAPKATPNPIPQPLPKPVQQQQQAQPHKEVRFDTEPTPAPSRVNIPQPPNPINNERGWKGSRPGNPRGGNQDVEMKDGDARKGTNGPQYHFTSKIQEHADPDKMFSTIGDMKVEVPLFQLLGLSPQLSKRFAEGTRTRREYGVPSTSSAELFPSSSDYSYEGDQEALASIVGTRGPALTERRVFVEKGDPDLEEFVFRCSNAAAQIPQTRFFAMTVGDVKLTINGTEFLAMIDSGSELNVASFDIPERGSLPMDFDGMKWKLKGINGDFEQLRGCVLDAKMRIGGHDFSHHVFISRHSLGRHDIILGQPFLQWFSARLDYERGAHVKLLLWADGNRASRPTLMISITDPEDPRNTTTIRGAMDPRPVSSSSFIEEVEDEDFRR